MLRTIAMAVYNAENSKVVT